jgi:hypothetical protein
MRNLSERSVTCSPFGLTHEQKGLASLFSLLMACCVPLAHSRASENGADGSPPAIVVRPPPARTDRNPERWLNCHDNCCKKTLIDNADDGDARTVHNGAWFTFDDGRGSTVHPPASAHGGTFAMSRGGNVTTAFAARAFGSVTHAERAFAGMGFYFFDARGPFDATPFGGIAFSARSGVPGAHIHVLLVDIAPETARTERFTQLGTSIELGTDWKTYTLRFSGLGGAPQAAVPKLRPKLRPNLAKLIGIRFQASRPGAFDVWVDEVRFVQCQGATRSSHRNNAPTCSRTLNQKVARSSSPRECPANTAGWIEKSTAMF